MLEVGLGLRLAIVFLTIINRNITPINTLKS